MKPHKLVDERLNKYYLAEIYMDFTPVRKLKRKHKTASSAQSYGEKAAARYERMKEKAME